VLLARVPPHVVRAVLAIEDQRFLGAIRQINKALRGPREGTFTA
jgi:hypothetical protein